MGETMKLHELTLRTSAAALDPALRALLSHVHRIRADHRRGAGWRWPDRLGRRAHLAGLQQRDARRRLGILPGARRSVDRQERQARPRRWWRGNAAASKVAATALLTAIEMLEDHPLLRIDREVRLPLLTPFNSAAPKEIEAEVERLLEDGFRTFKIKVGKDADADLERVKTIQRAIAGRATMRIDANRAYTEADACRFAAGLEPSGIELFEQPCRAEDWEANARVGQGLHRSHHAG